MKLSQQIVIFGPDASGKSTHARLLAEYLRKEYNVYLTEVSIRHLVMFLVFKFFNKYGRKIKVGPSRLLPVLPKDSVRLLLEFSSIVLLVLKIKLLSVLGYVIIIEKYIPFTIASLTYIYGSSFVNSKIASVLSRFMDGACQIRLDIDYPTHLSRRGMDSENLEWILCQKQIYDRFARRSNCITINTERTGLEETQTLIRETVNNRLKINLLSK